MLTIPLKRYNSSPWLGKLRHREVSEGWRSLWSCSTSSASMASFLLGQSHPGKMGQGQGGWSGARSALSHLVSSCCFLSPKGHLPGAWFKLSILVESGIKTLSECLDNSRKINFRVLALGLHTCQPDFLWL